jgi:hypothetical protein
MATILQCEHVTNAYSPTFQSTGWQFELNLKDR